jgi:hypothetical protein
MHNQMIFLGFSFVLFVSFVLNMGFSLTLPPSHVRMPFAFQITGA